MDYSQIMNILYNSKEIANIVDSMERSVPFFCTVKGKETISFLYWETFDSLELRKLLAVDSSSGEIYTLDREELAEGFGLSSLTFSPIVISDYDEYFADKDRYEEIFKLLCESSENYPKYGHEQYELLKRIVGQELFDGFFSIAAADYLSKLTR